MTAQAMDDPHYCFICLEFGDKVKAKKELFLLHVTPEGLKPGISYACRKCSDFVHYLQCSNKYAIVRERSLPQEGTQ